MEQNKRLYLTSDQSVLLDPNYRYVISTMEYKKMNKKGTIITTLENLETFSKLLLFDKNILIKVIGKKLSCKTGVDKSTKLYFLQGDYIPSHINEIIYEFIRNYLLCKLCDKPEINLKIKNNKIRQKCKACGNKCYLENSDEDVNNIIIKNKDLL